MIYLDAAYIAKFYVDEPDPARVREFLATAQPAASCLHAMAEVASVFHRKLREGTVPQTDFENFCAQFEADCDAGLMWKMIVTTSRTICHLSKSSGPAAAPR